VDAARAAVDWGADYLVAGTVFASASHPGEPAAGLAFLAQVCAAVRVPVLAIGGVTPANLADCLRAGAAGVAVLSPLQGADPRAVAAAYVAALRGGGQA
jgi:thiazole tautomerase (transcriptional regulator TenI)